MSRCPSEKIRAGGDRSRTRFVSHAAAVIALTLIVVYGLKAQNEKALLSTVKDFLNTWYITRDYGRLMQFVAKDNALSDQGIRSEMSRDGHEVSWSQIFGAGVPSRSARFAKLEDAITYSIPSLPADSGRLKYLNAGPGGEVKDPFAIIDPASAPPGSLLPRADLPERERLEFDSLARYLDRLNRDYKGHLYVVVYTTKGRDLPRETAVLYWILEDGWKLALFQGTDW